MAHGGVDAEDALGRVGVAVVDGLGVVGQALREVPLGPVDVRHGVAGEHGGEPRDGRQSAGAVPAVDRSLGADALAQVGLGGDAGCSATWTR